jgi:hypothetical protein
VSPLGAVQLASIVSVLVRLLKQALALAMLPSVQLPQHCGFLELFWKQKIRSIQQLQTLPFGNLWWLCQFTTYVFRQAVRVVVLWESL